MKTVMVRYTVKPDQAEKNKELVRAVYDELGSTKPQGFAYGTFVLEDGVSFVHFAIQADDGPGPLGQVEAFKRFQQDIGDRLESGPVVSQLSEVGSYRLTEAAG